MTMRVWMAPQGNMPRPASAKQIAFITRLATEPDHVRSLSGAAASRLIDDMLQRRVAPRAAVATAAPAPRATTPALTECGMYRTEDGTLYKVQKARGSEHLYAKKLTRIGGERLTENNEVVRWEFVYERGALYRLTPAMRLTLEQAKAFGIQYGVCCVCGAFLKDATSVAQGIGPICAGRV